MDEYVPEGQSKHALEPVEFENEPAEQLVHSLSPGIALNVPAEHLMHGPPLLPVNPLMHWQSLLELAMTPKVPELGGQVEQT